MAASKTVADETGQTPDQEDATQQEEKVGLPIDCDVPPSVHLHEHLAVWPIELRAGSILYRTQCGDAKARKAGED